MALKGVTRQHSPVTRSTQNQLAVPEASWDPMKLVEQVVDQMGGRVDARKASLNQAIAETQTTLQLLQAGFDSLPGGESAKVAWLSGWPLIDEEWRAGETGHAVPCSLHRTPSEPGSVVQLRDSLQWCEGCI